MIGARDTPCLFGFDGGWGLVPVLADDVNVIAGTSDMEGPRCGFEAPITSQVLIYPRRKRVALDRFLLPLCGSSPYQLRLSLAQMREPCYVDKVQALDVSMPNIGLGHADHKTI